MAMFSNQLPSFDDLTEHLDCFRALSKEYSHFALEAGVKLAPYREDSLPLFRKLNPASKKEVLHALKVAVRICRNTKAQGKEVGDAPSLTWQALKEIGLRPPSDLFSYIGDCNVVEVYSPRNIQLFRSFSFFQFCSYTLEDLYCNDWINLFTRDNESVVGQILEFASDVFEGRLKRTTPLHHIPPHVVREAISEGRYASEMRVRWGAPLFLDGTDDPGAAIVLENCSLIEKSDGRSKPVETPKRPQLSLVGLDLSAHA